MGQRPTAEYFAWCEWKANDWIFCVVWVKGQRPSVLRKNCQPSQDVVLTGKFCGSGSATVPMCILFFSNRFDILWSSHGCVCTDPLGYVCVYTSVGLLHQFLGMWCPSSSTKFIQVAKNLCAIRCHWLTSIPNGNLKHPHVTVLNANRLFTDIIFCTCNK